MTITKKLKENKIMNNFLYRLLRYRAEETVKDIENYFSKEDYTVDIGAGGCNITEVMREKGYKIKPIDIRNSSFVKGLEPLVYDGEKIPFKDNEFTASLIVTVLHHAPNNRKIIEEAMRVSQKKIVIIEDIYTGSIHKKLTFFMDSLVNIEFQGHPHTNRSDKEWKELFKELGLKIKDAKYRKSRFPFLYHATYYLEK